MMCAASSTVVFPVGTVATAHMFERSGPPANAKIQPPEGLDVDAQTRDAALRPGHELGESEEQELLLRDP